MQIESGRADVPVRVASVIVQIDAPRPRIGAIVAITEPKGHRPEVTPASSPVISVKDRYLVYKVTK